MIFIFFIFGLCVGSFLNVVIDRPMQKRSIVMGRSSCDYCHHHLAWYDLLPVVSFIFLNGRCRYCHKKLSLQYPAVELLTATLFFLVYLYLPHQILTDYLSLFVVLGLVVSGIALFIADIKYQLLPNNSLISLALFSLLFLFPLSYGMLFLRIETAFLAGLPFFLIFLFSKGKGMGFGDVKLACIMGFLLGFPDIIIAFYTAFLTGALVAIILILGRKVRFHGGTMAFGPFLLLGTAIALIWGDKVWQYIRIIIGF